MHTILNSLKKKKTKIVMEKPIHYLHRSKPKKINWARKTYAVMYINLIKMQNMFARLQCYDYNLHMVIFP